MKKQAFTVRCYDTNMSNPNVWELDFWDEIALSELENELDVAFEGYLDEVVGMHGDRQSIHYDYHTMFEFMEKEQASFHNLHFACKVRLDAVLTGNNVILL